MTDTNLEERKFDAEIGKVLRLMIHSVYTNKEIFLRELVSNASDACDKLRYQSITNPELIKNDPNFQINIILDQDNKTITIKDNGIGMSKDELIKNLGTIAHSGTQNFLEQLSGDVKKDNLLIGQFGVGFYAAYMVADLVTVYSKSALGDQAYKWSSNGIDSYQISVADKEINRGTEVIVHLKDSEADFLEKFRIKTIVKNYSNHISIPIYFIENEETRVQINQGNALWTESKKDITPEQYEEFYRNVSYSADKPWLIMHNKQEGTVEFTNLLFIPSNKTFDLFHPDRRCRVKLYIKRVFITDESIEIVPKYLRFLRGIVDCEDLPLNISRETLQNNPKMQKIKEDITKKVIKELKKQKDTSREEYENFWGNFGAVLKEGLCESISDHNGLLETCLFKSALHNKFITLDEYISNMSADQKEIYYFSGEDEHKLRSSSQIEGFLKKNIDVLLFVDNVDDFWVSTINNYKEHALKSVTRSDITLDAEQIEQNDVTQQDNLCGYFKEVLGHLVKDVIISKKLSESPVCLSIAEGSLDIRMERFLIEQKQLVKSSAKILEINLKHKIIKKIMNDLEQKSSADNLVRLLFAEACIIAGEPVENANEFSQHLNSLIERASNI